MLQYLHSKHYKVTYTDENSLRHTVRHSVRHSVRHTIRQSVRHYKVRHTVRHLERHSVRQEQDYACHDDHMEGGICTVLLVMRDKFCWQLM